MLLTDAEIAERRPERPLLAAGPVARGRDRIAPQHAAPVAQLEFLGDDRVRFEVVVRDRPNRVTKWIEASTARRSRPAPKRAAMYCCTSPSARDCASRSLRSRSVCAANRDNCSATTSWMRSSTTSRPVAPAGQCMATFAIVKKETNSWYWPIGLVLYMTLLAYISALIVYQTGLLLGYS